MSGVKVQIQVDDRQINAALDRLIAVGQSPREVMRDIATYGENSTRDRFKQQAGPDGTPWKPLKGGFFKSIPKKHLRKDGKLRSTQKAFDFIQGRKILIKSNRLINSIVPNSGNNFAEWGSNVIYAAIHQAGGKAGRGHTVEIPARPYLGINADDEANIVDIVNQHLADAVNG